MKKWLATCAAMTAVCIVAPQVQAAEAEVGQIISQDGIDYEVILGLQGDKQVEVLGTTSLTNRAHINIPTHVNGMVVTSIAPYAFYVSPSESPNSEYENVQSVTLPNTLRNIGEGAFQETVLQQIDLPDSVNSIGSRAFANSKLTRITLPKNLTRIEEGTFVGNELTTVELPSVLQAIGEEAFARNKLTSVTWSPMLHWLSNYAFASNPITTLILPVSIAKFDISMFLYDVEPYTFPYEELRQIVVQGSSTVISNPRPTPKFLGFYTDAALTKPYDKLGEAIGIPTTLYLSWTMLQPSKPIFSDIEGHWAQGAIESFADKGIITGYPDGTFKPGAPIQRKHVARILNNVFPLEATQNITDFNDVSPSHPYYVEISRVQRAGIFSGDNGNFMPEANLTRGQLAKVLVLAAGFEPGGNTTFKDTPNTYWATPYISTLADLAIVKGTDGFFHPNNPITRAQFVSMTSLALEEMERRANR